MSRKSKSDSLPNNIIKENIALSELAQRLRKRAERAGYGLEVITPAEVLAELATLAETLAANV